MSLELFLYVLAGLSALVVVLTRLRFRRDQVAGRTRVPSTLVNAHTAFGIVGLGLWIGFLLMPREGTSTALVGIASIGCLWILSACGLLIMMRWLPTRGRHAEVAAERSWTDGPALSILAHVGLLVAVLIDTVAYMLELV